MNKKTEIKQRDVYMCSFKGMDSEYQGVHPCLVLSVNKMNENNSKITVAPITHQDKKKQPTHYYLYNDKYTYFSQEKNTLLCEDICTVSKNRLQKYMGKVAVKDFIHIKKRIWNIFTVKPYESLN